MKFLLIFQDCYTRNLAIRKEEEKYLLMNSYTSETLMGFRVSQMRLTLNFWHFLEFISFFPLFSKFLAYRSKREKNCT